MEDTKQNVQLLFFMISHSKHFLDKEKTKYSNFEIVTEDCSEL